MILNSALLTQLKINSAKNLNFIAENPLVTEVSTEEITVPEFPAHMPGMGGVEETLSLDDSSFGDDVQFVTKEVKKIKFLEKYTFNDEGIITGKEESSDPFESWY